MNGKASVTPYTGLQITDISFLRRVFLIIPAALIAAATSVGYLRRVQREVYDYLTIARYRPLAKTGLHELRLPADHTLGLFVLREEGGHIGKFISYVVSFLSTFAFVVYPIIYVAVEALINVRLFGPHDLLCAVSSTAAILLCACSFAIIFLSGRIKA